MKKNVQRINESQLRAIVAETVKKVLKENISPLSSNEMRELVASARDYESGEIEIWIDENCPDELDRKTCLKIWLKAHKEDIQYYNNIN